MEPTPYDSPFLLLFLLVPIVVFPLIWRKRRRACLIVLAIYLASYLPFTLGGEYVIANHGGSHWTREWLPRHLMVRYIGFVRPKTTLTYVGAIYWPCIVLDRILWHRTEDLEDY